MDILEGVDMFSSGGIDLLYNLLSLSLVNLDKGLMSVDPVSVVGASARLVLHDDNLLSSLAASLDDWLELSDLLLVDLDLFVQIIVDSNSNSVLNSDKVSLLILSALNSNFENLGLFRCRLSLLNPELLYSYVDSFNPFVEVLFPLHKLNFFIEISYVSLLNSDLVVNRLASRNFKVFFCAKIFSYLELDNSDLCNFFSGDIVSFSKDLDFVSI